jgi:alpha-glucosidase
MTERHDLDWWQTGVFYQIYVRSFQDSNADGIGDLPGILERLDYLDWLGIDCIWLTPFYPSPQHDFGYDVADATDVEPDYGTLEDFDELVEAVHDREMRIIVDLVPNHTSHEHPWFQASQSGRDNPKRDWYVWADPARGGEPPTNWMSAFGGSAWEWHEGTGQYYLHSFLPEQPDLNWYNPEVREAYFDIMRFWLDRGADGFRVDVMWHLIKDKQLRNNPPNPDHDPEQDHPYESQHPVFSADRPEVHEVVRQMRSVVDEYDDRVMIGEVYLPIGSLVSYYGEPGQPEAHMPFNFQLIDTPWDASHLRHVADRYEAAVEEYGWPNWVLGNHDVPRVASRIGRDQAAIAAMLQMTLRGTPTIYYGDELGMTDGEIPEDRILDPAETCVNRPGFGRDPERTPMQWSAAEGAGFTEGDETWLPLAEGWEEFNVDEQRSNSHSMLALYRRLIDLHHREPAITAGEFVPVEVDGGLFSYLRYYRETVFLIAVNIGSERRDFDPKYSCGEGIVVISTHESVPEARVFGDGSELRPHEGVVVRLEAKPEYYVKPTASTMGKYEG